MNETITRYKPREKKVKKIEPPTAHEHYLYMHEELGLTALTAIFSVISRYSKDNEEYQRRVKLFKLLYKE
jgi:hypothetical protein